MEDDKTIVVRATQTGFANGHRVRPGQTFSVSESQFSPRWMEKTAEGTVDQQARAVEASPKHRGKHGVEVKGAVKPAPGTRRAETPDTGI